MPEEPKRLAPTNEVVRELYLKSGNRCAFPGCYHLIMDKDGFFIAQLCHIESALPDGPRFNPSQYKLGLYRMTTSAPWKTTANAFG